MEAKHPEKIKVEVVIADSPNGILVDLDRDADYILVLKQNPHVTTDQAKQISKLLRECFGRPIPVLITEGDVQVLRIPKETDEPREPYLAIPEPQETETTKANDPAGNEIVRTF